MCVQGLRVPCEERYMSLPNTTIEQIPVESLLPYLHNAREHSDKQIRQVANCIKEFGFIGAIIIDADNGIIAGHCRVKAAEKLEIPTVPCIRVEHLSEAQKKAFIIADNKLAENARWNNAQLANEFLQLREAGFAIELTGFELPEINVIIEDSFSIDDKGDAPEEIPEPQKTAVSQIGDIWKLGSHRVLCGSALEEGCYQTLFGAEQATMTFTDPPYNVPISGHVTGKGQQKHREFVQASGEMSEDEFTRFLRDFKKLIAAYSKSGAIHFVCMDWRHIGEMHAAAKGLLEFKNLCVWTKDNAGMGSFYRSQHELVFVYKSGAGKHINNFALGQYGRHRTNVWAYAGANSFGGRNGDEGNPLDLHPTVKPVQMIADAIDDCSYRNDIVFDGFLGSGSTLVAAEKTGRRCYGIELDPLYVDVIIRRWQALTGQPAVHAVSGKTFDETMQNIRQEDQNDA